MNARGCPGTGFSQGFLQLVCCLTCTTLMPGADKITDLSLDASTHLPGNALLFHVLNASYNVVLNKWMSTRSFCCPCLKALGIVLANSFALGHPCDYS